MADKIDELYDALKADGIVQKDRDNFRNYMLAPGEAGYKNRLTLYKALKADGIVSSPTYEEFGKRLGLRPKQQSASTPAKSNATATPQQPTAQPSTKQPAQAQKPAKPKKDRLYTLRQGGQDFEVLESEVLNAGGFEGYAKKRGGAPLRVYMKDKQGKRVHVAVGSVKDRVQKGYYAEAKDYKPWIPTPQQKAAFKAKTDAVVQGFQQHSEDVLEQMERSRDYMFSSESLQGKPKKGKPKFNPQTGKIEQTYITPYGNETTSEVIAQSEVDAYKKEQQAVSLPGRIKTADARVKELEDKLNKRYQELYKGYTKKKDERPWYLKATQTAVNAEAGYDLEWEQAIGMDPQYNALKLSLDQAKKGRQQLLNAQDHQHHGGFWHDFGRSLIQTDVSEWDFGKSDIRNALTMINLNNRQKAGAKLMPEEEDALMDMAVTESIMQQFGDLGKGYRYGNITRTSFSFMKDFILTGGFGSLSGVASATARGAGRLATQAAIKIGGRQAAKATLKAGEKVAERMAKREIAGQISRQGLRQFVKANGIKGIGALVKEQALPWTIKAMGTTADDLLVRAPLMSATIQGQSTAAKVIEEKLGKVEYDEATGNLKFADGSTWNNAIWQAGADQVIENFSEMWGAHLPGLSEAAKSFGARTLSAAILKNTREGAGTVISKAAQFLKRAGVNGYFSEVGEEYYGQLWRTGFSLDSAYQPKYDEDGNPVYKKDKEGNILLDEQGNPIQEKLNNFFDGQFHGDIWGGMALSVGLTGGGAMVANAGLKYAGDAVDYMQLRNMVNRTDKSAKTLLGEDWDAMRLLIDTTDNDNIGALAEQVWQDAEMQPEEKKAVLNYMEASMIMRGHNMREFTQRTGRELDARDELVEAYNEGVNITSAEDRNRAAMNLRYRAEKMREALGAREDADCNALLETMYSSDDINEIFTKLYGDKEAPEDARKAITEYLKAANIYNGMMQTAEAEEEQAVAELHEEINANADVTGEEPMLRPATLKVEDEPVYILSGNVMLHPDESGTIDVRSSDSTIVIRRADGTREMRSPSDLMTLGDEQAAAEVLTAREQELRSAMQEERIAQVNGTLRFNPGDAVQFDSGEGEVVNATVVQRMDNGIVLIQTPEDGKNYYINEGQLQDFHDRAMYEAFKANMMSPEEIFAANDPEAEHEEIEAPEEETSQPETEAAQTENLNEERESQPLYQVEDELIIPPGVDPQLEGATDARIVDIDQSDPSAPQYVVEYTDANGQQRTFNADADRLSRIAILSTPPSIESEGTVSVAEPVAGEHPVYNPNQEGEELRVPEASQVTIPDLSEPAAQPQAEQMAGPTPLQRVPHDEKGKPMFEAVEPDLAWDALVEKTADAEMAQRYAEQKVNGSQKALEKATKAKTKEIDDIDEFIKADNKRKQAIVDAQAALDHWKKIASTSQRRAEQAESERVAEARKRSEERRIQQEADKSAQEEEYRQRVEALNGVPDVSQDKPKDARARGYRRVGVDKVERQAPIKKAILGKDVEVKFSKDVLPKGRMALIESSQLQPSHIQGKRNPYFFIDEAQPKNRADGGISELSAREIAQNIRPNEITSAPTAYAGAPTVNARGEVIQGNNRSDALKYMYESEKESSETYKQYLADHAEDFGLTREQVESMENPVLVNMLDVDDNEAIRLGQFTSDATESGGVERIKPKHAMKLIGDKMPNFANMLMRSGEEEASLSECISANGQQVLRWMSQNGFITETQFGSALRSDGKLTDGAKEDLQNILFQSTFEGGPSQLEEMFASLPAKAQKAILATSFRDFDSPLGEKMREDIQQSIVAYYMLIGNQAFAEATSLEDCRNAVEVWKRTYAMDMLTGDSIIPADNFSNFALLLAAYYKGETQKNTQKMFNALYDMVQGVHELDIVDIAEGKTMEDYAPVPLREAIKKILNIEYQPPKKNENGNNRTDVVDVDHQGDSQGRQGSDGASASGEQSPAEAEPAERGARVAGDSGGSGTSGNLQSIAERGENTPQEVDENGLPFVVAEDGTTIFGEIKDDCGLTEAPIKLSEGYHDEKTKKGYGLKHIEANHGKQIREAGFKSVEEFISYVAKNFDPDNIRVGKRRENGSGTFLIQVTTEHDNTLYVELSKDGSYWNVNSGGVFRKGYSNKKETVAKTEPQQPNNAVSDNSSLSIDEKGGTASIEPNGEPTVSADKVNASSAHKQEKGAESSLQLADVEQTQPETEPAEPYTITQETYKGKHKDTKVYVVRFNRELSKEEMAALKSVCNQPLAEGRKATKGWWWKDANGFAMRSEQSAKELAAMIGNEEAVADAKPLSREDIVEAVKPAEPKAEPKTRKKKPAVNRVNVEELFGGLQEKGEAKLDDNSEPVQPATAPKGKFEVTDEMRRQEEELRNLLGIDDDEGDTSKYFRDGDQGLSAEQKRKVFAIGVNYAFNFIDNGITDIKAFAEAVTGRLGDKVKPFIKAWYQGAKNMPGYEDVPFSTDEEVTAFDTENFDKPNADQIAHAEMILAERKVAEDAAQAEQELKSQRNERRKETEKQRAADSDAIANEGEAVASQAQADAETQSDGAAIAEAERKVDSALEKVNDQLVVLGHYDAPQNYAFNERAALADAGQLTNRLFEDLGIDAESIPASTEIITSNFGKDGGIVTIKLPVHSEYEPAKVELTFDRVKSGLHLMETAVRVPKGGDLAYIIGYDNRVWLGDNLHYSELLESLKKSVGELLAVARKDETIFDKAERIGKEAVNKAKQRPMQSEGPELSGNEQLDIVVNQVGEEISNHPQFKAAAKKARRTVDKGDIDTLEIIAGELTDKIFARNIDDYAKDYPYVLTIYNTNKDALIGAIQSEALLRGLGNKSDAAARKPSKKKSVPLASDTKVASLFDFEEPVEYDNTNETNNGLQRNDGNVRRSDHSGQRSRPAEDTRGAGQEIGQDSRGADTRGEGGERHRTGSVRPRLLHPVAEGERRNTSNNRAERGTDYAPKGVDARIKANIRAIELLHKLQDEGRSATVKEMAVLRQFSGWGGLGKAFSDEIYNRQLQSLLGAKAYDDAQKSRKSAYYTPAYIIDSMWDIVRGMGFQGGRVLEGSAGIGNILGLMPQDFSDRSEIHAVEYDSTTGAMLGALYPDAQVEVKGFEETRIENGSVDLAITNVPFITGWNVKDTSGDKDLSRKFRDIHDFCIAKNIRKLREGGIGVFITSSGTLDNSAKLRAWITNEGCADVVGVFRMHNETFGGTGATSDIIVVKKRVNGRISANAIDVAEVVLVRNADYDTGETKTVKGEEVPIIKTHTMRFNKYFDEHPGCMAGEMLFNFERGETRFPTSRACFPVKGKDQGKMLAEWAQRFAECDWDKPQERETFKPKLDSVGDEIKTGTMIVDSRGRICINMNGRAVPVTPNTKPKGYAQLSPADRAKLDEERSKKLSSTKVKGRTKTQCLDDYNAIKRALSALLEYQKANDSEEGLQPLLKALNNAFDTFVGRYGHLHANVSLSWLRNDVDFASIMALETYTHKSEPDGSRREVFGKSDIFTRRVLEKETEPKPTNVKDAVITSIYKHGRLDIPYMAEALGKTEKQMRKEIVESGLGFENPVSKDMEVAFVYLSGNVREKLQQAKELNVDGKYDANVKALERVIPMDIPAHLIDFALGSTWVDPKLYEAFVYDRTGVRAKLTPAGGSWFMGSPSNIYNPKNKEQGVRSEKFGTTTLGHEIIDAAINNRTITISKTVKDSLTKKSETITDYEATSAIGAKVEELRSEFKDWARAHMQSDPELAQRLETTYNERFNNSVARSIPDEFVPDHFGGAVTVLGGQPFRLREHQAKSVVRGTMQSLLLAHEVGTGKTFTLISTAMEMRRLGTARKPMIVVQNATVGQFVESAKELYPSARILTIEDNEKDEEGRKAFYAKIKYNDWDMIVVPQSVFERIPDSMERQVAFIQDKIEEKMKVLEDMQNEDPDGKSAAVRQAKSELEKTRLDLSALTASMETKRAEKDAKRVAQTRHNAEVKAQEMLDRKTDDVEDFDQMGIDALLIDEAHEYKHLGFATAMQRGVKGVDPSYSKKAQGVFLKTQAVKERSNGRNVIMATGTPISNTAAEIWTFMRYLMDADTMKEFGIYYFDDFVRNFGSLQQMLEFTTSGKFKEVNRFAGYYNLPELVRIWSTVADTVLTREAGEVQNKIPELEGGKAQDIYLPQTRALRSVMMHVIKELDAYDKMSGKEKKENSHIPLVMYGIAKAAAVDARLVVANADDDPNSKTNEAVRQTLRSLEESSTYKGTVAIFADSYRNKQSGFNLYEDVKKKLIAQGVAAEQIVIMTSGMTVKKKLEIFDAVNRGDVRVVMGSTFTLGTGVNIQERLHTLIHIDAPNRPMDYTQRNGRILRQGNLHKKWGIPVRVLRFGVEDSLDVTAYQRLKTKGAIADSIMNGKQLLANPMENRVMEEEEDVFGDITAQLSGSEYAMLKNQAEKLVRKFTSELKNHEAHQTYIHNQLPRLRGQIKTAQARIEQAQKALDTIGTERPGTITIGKQKFASIDEMDKFFTEHNKKINEASEAVKAGAPSVSMKMTINIGGIDFEVSTKVERTTDSAGNTLMFSSERDMTYSCPALGIENSPVTGKRLKAAVTDMVENVMSGKDFKERIEIDSAQIDRMQSEMAQLESQQGKQFEHTKELEEAEARLEEYTEKMKKELEAKEAKYADMDSDVEAVDSDSISFTDEEEEREEEEQSSDDGKKMRVIGEQDLLDFLNSQPLKKGYRYAQWANMSVLPPMTAKVDGKWRAPMIFSQWEQSEEGMMNADGKADLVQGNGRTTGDVAYNPYFHIRVSPLNDQFTAAWDRPELIVVEGYYPESEETSGYHADGAKDSVGLMNWHSGSVNGQLSEDTKVQTMLSRYFKPVRIVPWSEVADLIMERIGDQQVVFPINVVPPMLRAELAKRGVVFGDISGSVGENDIDRLNDIRERISHGEYDAGLEEAQAYMDAYESSEAAKVTRAEQLSQKLNTPIRLITDSAEIEALPTRRERRAKGWYDPKTNEVVIIVPNIDNVADIENTFVHEVVGHKGLRAFIGEERFDSFLDEVYNHLTKGVRAKVDEMAQANYKREITNRKEKYRKQGETPVIAEAMATAEAYKMQREGVFQRDAMEEYMSDLAGRIGDKGFEAICKEEKTVWQKIKDLVQKFLDKFLANAKIAKSITLSDEKLQYILFRSWQYAQRKEGVFADAENVVMKHRTGWDASYKQISSKRERIEQLRKSVPIEVSEEMIPSGIDLTDRKAVKSTLKSSIRGFYINESTGERLRVSKVGINEVTSHGMTDEAHVKSLFAIPAMLQKSIFIDEKPNEKGHNEYDSYRYYVCGLKIDGEDYTAKIVVGVKNGQTYYDHRLTQIEKGKLIDSENGLSDSGAKQ